MEGFALNQVKWEPVAYHRQPHCLSLHFSGNVNTRVPQEITLKAKSSKSIDVIIKQLRLAQGTHVPEPKSIPIKPVQEIGEIPCLVSKGKESSSLAAALKENSELLRQHDELEAQLMTTSSQLKGTIEKNITLATCALDSLKKLADAQKRLKFTQEREAELNTLLILSEKKAKALSAACDMEKSSQRVHAAQLEQLAHELEAAIKDRTHLVESLIRSQLEVVELTPARVSDLQKQVEDLKATADSSRSRANITEKELSSTISDLSTKLADSKARELELIRKLEESDQSLQAALGLCDKTDQKVDCLKQEASAARHLVSTMRTKLAQLHLTSRKLMAKYNAETKAAKEAQQGYAAAAEQMSQKEKEWDAQKKAYGERIENLKGQGDGADIDTLFHSHHVTIASPNLTELTQRAETAELAAEAASRRARKAEDKLSAVQHAYAKLQLDHKLLEARWQKKKALLEHQTRRSKIKLDISSGEEELIAAG